MSMQIPQRFYSLDLVRGLASLAVVFWHWQHFFYDGSTFSRYVMEAQPFYSVFFVLYKTGWLAVDFFFSLSGFIFFWLYAQKIAERRVGGWEFFVLRFSRLYPLHIATFIFVLLLQHWIFTHTGDYFVTPFNDAYHGFLQLFMASNWGFQKGASFNGPVWSVSIEVLMYMLFFLLCLTFRMRIWAMVAMVVLGALMSAWQQEIARGLFSFFIGGLLFRFYRLLCEKDLVQRASVIVVSSALLLWLATLLEVRYSWFWPQVEIMLQSLLPAPLDGLVPQLCHMAMRFMPVGILFPLTILALALVETWRGHLGRRLAAISNLTYASYLLHFPLQMVLWTVVMQAGGDKSFFYKDSTMLLFFAVLIPLCLASYYYFEAPAQTRLRTMMLSVGRKVPLLPPKQPQQ